MPAVKQTFSIPFWTFLTFLGWIVGFPIVFEIGRIAWATNMKGEWVVGSGLALGVGLLQWLYLRSRLPQSYHWVWIILISMTISWLAAGEINTLLNFGILIQVMVATIAGASLTGWLQWRLVLKAHGASLLSWMCVTISGWTLSSISLCLIFYDEQISKFLWEKLPLALPIGLSGGLLLGWITGMKLKPLFDKPEVSEDPRIQQ